jgi:hypothetical protein
MPSDQVLRQCRWISNVVEFKQQLQGSCDEDASRVALAAILPQHF